MNDTTPRPVPMAFSHPSTAEARVPAHEPAARHVQFTAPVAARPADRR
jgi:hypothetical protein